jgi:formylmethanofuran dehydrogenase subunit E
MLKIIITVLFLLMTGCTNNKMVYECNYKINDIPWEIENIVESEDGLVTKVTSIEVIAIDAVELTREEIIKIQEDKKEKNEDAGMEYSYEINEDNAILTITTVFDLDKIDNEYLENESIFSLINSRSVDELIEAIENTDAVCILQ